MGWTRETPLLALRGVGPARAAQLAALGLRTVEDLLFHLPLRYEDRRSVVRIAALVGAGAVTLEGTLHGARSLRVRRRRLSMVRARLRDDTGELGVVWFNRPYLAQQIDPARRYRLHGAARRRAGEWELVNPSVEPIESRRLTGAVVPIYPGLGRVGPTLVGRLVEQVLAGTDLDAAFPEELPPALLRRYGLPRLADALRLLHRPAGERAVADLDARRTPEHHRLVYGELLAQQRALAAARRARTAGRKRHGYALGAAVRRRLAAIPPFELTAAQRRVCDEILADLERPWPMSRLLQGDVGSGKTIVAALAAAAAAESGLQAAVMAPTELLAEQHHRELGALFGGRYRLELLTGASGGADAWRRLAAGEAQVAVGTHALIQQRVRFARLALAIVDEQHRFGVAQRQALQEKGTAPDLLVMTATPIPRSLALTVYGDLDLSLLDELPPGRRPVATRVVPDRRRAAVWRLLERRLEGSGQAYVVLPMIGESDRIAAASIEREGERLRRRLARFAPRLLHGRTGGEERERIMAEFAAGAARVLIATTIVEVGLDVPAATTMVIESAERFGLAQLHQLRGRVGRGAGSSLCVALHGDLSEEGRRRLEVFAATADGFRIAEADLEIRGHGDLLGTRQAGLPRLRIADPVADRSWLERARRDALEEAGEVAEERPDPRAGGRGAEGMRG